MRKYIIAVSIITLFISCKGQTQNKKAGDYQYENGIDALVKQYQDLDIFSGTVLVAEKGKILYNKAFGLANREKKIPNTLQTKFDIGSINKAFTKVIIMQLIQEGKIKTDDKLGQYLKGFPMESSEKITIEQLIGHRSGYGDYMQEPGFFDRPKSQQTMEAITEIIKNMSLMFEPGSDWQYSNAGYILLGDIIEKVTGKSYYDNVKDRIIKPLGMSSAVVDTSKKMATDRAIGYMKTMRGDLENNEDILLIPTPAGGFIMTDEDLLKFMEAYLFSDKLVKPEAFKYDDFYPFLQKLKKEGGAIPIAGGFEGANAVALNDIQKHQTIIVMANMDEPVAEQLATGIYNILNGKEPKKPSLPVLQNIYSAYEKNGIAYVKQHFEELSADFSMMEPKDMLLNNIGYNLLFSGETNKAIDMFKLNTELFPNIGNCWDSYGEALLKKGDKKAALAAYKKALSINPNIPSAQEAVKKLEQ
ncbi:MAG: beta-lactamase family protein [Ignavibacteriae bacterium]|nr:beta-lactamase family protein [Ignavibacteriota bacterium]